MRRRDLHSKKGMLFVYLYFKGMSKINTAEKKNRIIAGAVGVFASFVVAESFLKISLVTLLQCAPFYW